MVPLPLLEHAELGMPDCASICLDWGTLEIKSEGYEAENIFDIPAPQISTSLEDLLAFIPAAEETKECFPEAVIGDPVDTNCFDVSENIFDIAIPRSSVDPYCFDVSCINSSIYSVPTWVDSELNDEEFEAENIFDIAAPWSSTSLDNLLGFVPAAEVEEFCQSSIYFEEWEAEEAMTNSEISPSHSDTTLDEYLAYEAVYLQYERERATINEDEEINDSSDATPTTDTTLGDMSTSNSPSPTVSQDSLEKFFGTGSSF